MKFSYNWLKELAPFKESPQELAEFFALLAFEVESVEKRRDDWVLDVKITPNRVADSSGHLGLAREIAFPNKGKLRTPSSPTKNFGGGQDYERRTPFVENKKQKTSGLVRVKIENESDCPRYTGRMVTGVKIGESPERIQERLEICGIQSINNVVDAANYVMLELGQPLHVFDFDKLRTTNYELRTILVRRARKGEHLLALDEKTYELNPEVLVIADEQKPIAIAGIKGGKESGVSESTIALVLEAANFNPVVIRRGSRSLGLRTDASYRFEHGLHPSITERAIDRLAQLIQEIAGGNICGGRVDAYPGKQPIPKILFRPAYANSVIGHEMSPVFYKGLLERIGCAVNSKKQEALIVQPPPERLDLRIEEDLIEEAARALGYENIPIVMPHVSLIPPEHNEELFWEERIRTALALAGYIEYQPYLFTGERELKQFFAEGSGVVQLENPTGPETTHLVPRLSIKYASAAAELTREHEDVRLFGIGKEFSREQPTGNSQQGTKIQEEKSLVIAQAKKTSRGDEIFYTLKGAADQMLEELGISDHWYDDAVEAGEENGRWRMFHPYQKAEIKIEDEVIGKVGVLHPVIAENLKSRGTIAIAELDLTRLIKLATAEAEFRPIGKYPAVARDIAVVVPERTKTEEIQNVIEESAGDDLADVDLFDYFQDKELTARNTKSLAFHLVFQSPERTLTDEEVGASMQKIISTLEKQGWAVKK